MEKMREKMETTRDNIGHCEHVARRFEPGHAYATVSAESPGTDVVEVLQQSVPRTEPQVVSARVLGVLPGLPFQFHALVARRVGF